MKTLKKIGTGILLVIFSIVLFTPFYIIGALSGLFLNAFKMGYKQFNLQSMKKALKNTGELPLTDD